MADVLDDHVHVEALVGHGLEDGLGDARAIRDTDDGDLRHLAIERHGPDLVSQLHRGYLLDAGAWVVAERRAHPDDDVVDPTQLDGTRLHDLGALVGKLEHLLVADRGDQLGVAHDSWVGGEDAFDVGVDLAGIGVQASRQRHRCRIRASSPQRRDLAGGEGSVGRTLEAGHDDDTAPLDLAPHTRGVDVGDAGTTVAGVGADARLRAGQRDGLDALRVQCHGHERATHVLTGGQQQVHLARIWLVSDGRRELGQMIGGVTHRADHDHEVGAFTAITCDPSRDMTDALGVGQRRAAVFLDDESGHAPEST